MSTERQEYSLDCQSAGGGVELIFAVNVSGWLISDGLGDEVSAVFANPAANLLFGKWLLLVKAKPTYTLSLLHNRIYVTWVQLCRGQSMGSLQDGF
jgi:hypothetical protein